MRASCYKRSRVRRTPQSSWLLRYWSCTAAGLLVTKRTRTAQDWRVAEQWVTPGPAIDSFFSCHCVLQRSVSSGCRYKVLGVAIVEYVSRVLPGLPQMMSLQLTVHVHTYMPRRQPMSAHMPRYVCTCIRTRQEVRYVGTYVECYRDTARVETWVRTRVQTYVMYLCMYIHT
jgi:hypothetical protein